VSYPGPRWSVQAALWAITSDLPLPSVYSHLFHHPRKHISTNTMICSIQHSRLPRTIAVVQCLSRIRQPTASKRLKKSDVIERPTKIYKEVLLQNVVIGDTQPLCDTETQLSNDHHGILNTTARHGGTARQYRPIDSQRMGKARIQATHPIASISLPLGM
jgi:hypothetical protein